MRAEVVDASVLGAFVFQEPREGEAHALLEDAELFAPDLLPYELASIARKKVMLHPELRVSIIEALRVGLSLDIQLVQVEPVAVLGLALECGLTTYDASYLHVATSLGISLVTFDDQLRAAAARDS